MTGRTGGEGRDPARERLVKAARFDNVVEAQLAHDRLEQAGIRSLLKNVDPLSAYETGALPLAIDLFVLEGDAEAAADLLADEELPPPHAQRHHGPHRRRPRR